MNTSELEARLSVYYAYADRFGLPDKGFAHVLKQRKVSNRLTPWIPMRYCEDDWVLCVWVVRYSKHRYEIGLFLAEDHVLYVKDAGVMGGLIFALSDAYFKTGRMELRFVGPQPGKEPTLESGYEPEIPECIRRLAANLGVELTGRNVISDAEGRRLYARITGLSATATQILAQRGTDEVQACFAVNRGVWSHHEMEMILRFGADPATILHGGVPPEQRMMFKRDLLLLRFALMSERIRTHFELLTGPNVPPPVVSWMSENEFQITVNAGMELTDVFGFKRTVPPNVPLEVVLLPRDQFGYEFFETRDFARKPGEIAVVTKDLCWVPAEARTRIERQVRDADITVLEIVDTIGEMDQEILRRLGQLASTRRPLPERAE